jgi:hypothetical protein
MTNANEPHRPQGPTASPRLPAFLWRRTIVSDVVQGIIVGSVLAFITFQIIAHAYVTKINGWTTVYKCGEPGNDILLHGACGAIFNSDGVLFPAPIIQIGNHFTVIAPLRFNFHKQLQINLGRK